MEYPRRHGGFNLNVYEYLTPTKIFNYGSLDHFRTNKIVFDILLYMSTHVMWFHFYIYLQMQCLVKKSQGQILITRTRAKASVKLPMAAVCLKMSIVFFYLFDVWIDCPILIAGVKMVFHGMVRRVPSRRYGMICPSKFCPCVIFLSQQAFHSTAVSYS